MLDLYYWPTPNGKKVTILLEECGVDYNVIALPIATGAQFSDEFLTINPNGRMPALVDHAPRDGGAPLSVFESGAIMLYIAERTGQFMPLDVRGRYQILQWVMWQMANQGPKTGELGHYRRYAGDDDAHAYAIKRYDDEVNRMYGVLNQALYDNPYVAGSEYSIADMICYPWTVGWKDQGQNIEDFPHFKRWFEELSARPAVQTGMAVGEDEMRIDPSTLSAEEIERIKKLIFGQRARPLRT